MEKSPYSEATSFSANQEISRSFSNPNVHYLIHKRSPPVSILSYSTADHTS